MVPVGYQEVNYRQVVEKRADKTRLLLRGRIHHAHDREADLHVHNLARRVYRRKRNVADQPDKPADKHFLDDGEREHQYRCGGLNDVHFHDDGRKQHRDADCDKCP